MSFNRIEKLVAFLEGQLSPKEQQELEAELAQSPALQKELEELRFILEEVDNLPLEKPSGTLSTGFYKYLEEEIDREKRSSDKPLPAFWLEARPWISAAAIALLLIGLAFGGLWQLNKRHQAQIAQLQAEMKVTKKLLMLSMLQEASASDRIQALNTVNASIQAQKYSEKDPKIINALINTMNFDDNINVRTKAAEALMNFTTAEGVVEAMIESLEIQDSPEMQILLIDMLTAIKAKEASKTFRKFLETEAVHEIVRRKAAYGIEQLL